MSRPLTPTIGLLILLPATLVGQTVESDAEEEVREAATAFVEAFNDLAWDRFTEAWAPDATAFFPMPGYPRRLEGRDSIVEAFREIFEDVPDQRPGPPYLSIQPRDLHVHLTSDVAVVTFHLGDAPPFDRRSVVFERRGDRWLISHLHASRPPEG